MGKISILFALLTIFTLASCSIDEDKNYLFQLKDNIVTAGTWANAGGTDRFELSTDSSVKAIIGTTTYTGTFKYLETTSESIFDTDNIVGNLYFYWSSTAPSQGDLIENVSVKLSPNEDRYFDYDGSTYTQIS